MFSPARYRHVSRFLRGYEDASGFVRAPGDVLRDEHRPLFEAAQAALAGFHMCEVRAIGDAALRGSLADLPAVAALVADDSVLRDLYPDF